MTQEEKQLLLQDLCARLPFGVKVQCFGKNKEVVNAYAPTILQKIDVKKQCSIFNFEIPIESIQPYLRPRSSMTEEELSEYRSLCRYHNIKGTIVYEDTYKSFDWLNKHHFDYRGLILEGLAIEAPEEMYK